MQLKEYKLGDIGRVVTGKTPATSNNVNFEGGTIPFYTPEDVAKGFDIKSGNKRFITSLGFEEIKNNTIAGESVLVGCIGSDMGNVAYVNEICATNQQINSITDFKEFVEPLYVYYLLSTMKPIFRQLAGSTTTPILAKSVFENITISLPRLETQKRVCKILSSFDSKIVLNRQINQNLEALARQLYDYWFVQFDFPNEEGKLYKSSGGKMVYNPILKREIPEGWEVKKLGELCSINKRTSNGRYNSPILYLDTASITNNNIEMLQFLDPEKDEIPSRARRVVMEGDIVYSTVRPNLKHFGLLYDPKSNMVVSTGFAVITANWSAFRYYIYQFLKQDKVVDNLHSIAQSAVSSYPSINASDIQNLDIVVPSNIQIDAFAHIACKIHAQLEIHAQQILSLTKQRDELLPLLMNGQVNFDLSDD